MAQLIPVMLCFFTMGFVDLVGSATNFVKEDLSLSAAQAGFIPSLVFFWFLIFSVPTRIPPGMLNLELTERMTLDATDLMRAHMRRLGEYGVHFSLIDYSFGMVKFDKQMMDSYFVNESAQIILKNEFKTLKGLGIDIVVEGIETKAQVDKLEEEDMNYIQGYYFAKPAPAQDFLRLIQAQNA